MSAFTSATLFSSGMAAVTCVVLTMLRPGGTLVICGATSGPNPAADLNRVFFLQLNVVGSTMGTRSELESLLAMLATTGVRPTIDTTLPLARAGFDVVGIDLDEASIDYGRNLFQEAGLPPGVFTRGWAISLSRSMSCSPLMKITMCWRSPPWS